MFLCPTGEAGFDVALAAALLDGVGGGGRGGAVGGGGCVEPGVQTQVQWGEDRLCR